MSDGGHDPEPDRDEREDWEGREDWEDWEDWEERNGRADPNDGRAREERDEREQSPWEFAEEDSPVRWPLDWRGLYPRERWLWFQQLWEDVLALRERYRLPVRSAWWEDGVQVEALAALAAWVHRYDSGEWDDPPGKLALLYDLERVNVLLRDGNDPLHPERDRAAFTRHLLLLGCQPPGRPPQ